MLFNKEMGGSSFEISAYKQARTDPIVDQESTIEDFRLLWGAAYTVIVPDCAVSIKLNSYSRELCDAGLLLSAEENGTIHVGFFHFLPDERNLSRTFVKEMHEIQPKGIRKAVLVSRYDEDSDQYSEAFVSLYSALQTFSQGKAIDIMTINNYTDDPTFDVDENEDFGQLIFRYTPQSHQCEIWIPGAGYKRTFQNISELERMQDNPHKKKFL